MALFNADMNDMPQDNRPAMPPALAIRVADLAALSAVLANWGFGAPRPTLVLVGGADGMALAEQERLWPLFQQVLAPLADRLGVTIVDGGSDAGVMRLIGRARHTTRSSFPLIGVAPDRLLAWRRHVMQGQRQAAPAPHHTHFVLVPGDSWGVEGPWIAAVATTIAGGAPSVTLVINGGAITLQDVLHSVIARRPIVTLAGSGRIADQLGAALCECAASADMALVAASGLMRAVHLSDGYATVATVLRTLLTAPQHLDAADTCY